MVLCDTGRMPGQAKRTSREVTWKEESGVRRADELVIWILDPSVWQFSIVFRPLSSLPPPIQPTDGIDDQRSPLENKTSKEQERDTAYNSILLVVVVPI